MEVKVDKKGLVWVKGAAIKDAHNAKELYALFDEGSKNRHTASTSTYQYIDLLLYINKMVSDMEVEQNSSQNSFANG